VFFTSDASFFLHPAWLILCLSGDISVLMNETDRQLLDQYIDHGVEDAFTELVRRHLPLVYSAALRQVRSAHLAEEISQSVFADLARSGKHLTANTALGAWLYQVTRRTAIDLIRRETRRQLREERAQELSVMNSDIPQWKEIEPLLEEAMDSLDEADRTAVVLRFFQGKSLREVGEATGSSENAAQKRVTRSVERLQQFFATNGITVSASALAAALSANSVDAVPLALTTSIAATALQAAATKTATTAMLLKAFVMTTTQKVLVGTAVCVIIGTVVFQHLRQPAPVATAQTDELDRKSVV